MVSPLIKKPSYVHLWSKELHRLKFHLPHLSHAKNELPQVQWAALVNIHLRPHKGHDKVTVAKNPPSIRYYTTNQWNNGGYNGGMRGIWGI